MVSIIIVNYNTGDILKECISSLYTYESRAGFEVIIVDNNSTDNSRQLIDSMVSTYDNVTKLYLDKDKGFAYANNRGYELSKGEYILIMNPDIIFTMPVFEKLKQDLNTNNIGAVSPALIGQDGKFQRNYFQRYPSLLQYALFGSMLVKFFHRFPGLMNRYLENQDIDISKGTLQYTEQIPFAFFMLKREVFEDAGKMDEKYKLFFEDVDTSYQVGKKYKLAVDTSLAITHLGGSSFKTKDNWWLYGRYTMSMNYFFDKNYNFARAFLLKLFTVTNSLFIVITEKLKKLIGKPDKYRFEKHRYFLKEFFNYYF